MTVHINGYCVNTDDPSTYTKITSESGVYLVGMPAHAANRVVDLVVENGKLDKHNEKLCRENANLWEKNQAVSAENAKLREAAKILLMVTLPPHDVSGSAMYEAARKELVEGGVR